MVNGNRYSTGGTPAVIAPDPAPPGGESVYGMNTPAGGELGQTTEVAQAPSLERLAERVEGIAVRLEALSDAVRPLIEKPAGVENTDSSEPITRGIEAATEALIYTDFFQKAVELGMSPNMVADAYRLADLARVSADLETKDVTGIKEAVNNLLEKKPYLFFVHQGDVGSETNPVTAPSSHPEQVENLARTLGISPEFAAELVKKRSDKTRGSKALSDIWRVPRTNRLSFLENIE